MEKGEEKRGGKIMKGEEERYQKMKSRAKKNLNRKLCGQLGCIRNQNRILQKGGTMQFSEGERDIGNGPKYTTCLS